jgi:hypothetical protein
MKKKILLMAIGAITFATTALAQVNIGVNTGVNFSSAKAESGGVTSNGKLLFGFHAGVTADIALTPELHALPTLQFRQKGTKVKDEQSILGQLIKAEGTTTINYIELPLNIVYNFDLGESAKFFVGAGPSFAYAVSGKTKITTTSPLGNQVTDRSLKLGSNQDDDIKPFDLGVNGLLGLKFNNGFAVTANYTHSLSNLSPKDNTSYKGRSFGVSLHYFFNSDKEK